MTFGSGSHCRKILLHDQLLVVVVAKKQLFLEFLIVTILLSCASSTAFVSPPNCDRQAYNADQRLPRQLGNEVDSSASIDAARALVGPKDCRMKSIATRMTGASQTVTNDTDTVTTDPSTSNKRGSKEASSVSAEAGLNRRDPKLKNARFVTGTRACLYRCAKTDDLADLLPLTPETEHQVEVHVDQNDSTLQHLLLSRSDLHPDEHLLLHDAGLVVDLRSPSERNDDKCKTWWTRAPGGPLTVVHSVREYEEQLLQSSVGTDPTSSNRQRKRFVLLLDPMSSLRFMEYLERHWMTPAERWKATWYKLVDGASLHNLRLDVLNRRGLLGLNQAILEAGANDIRQALQALTIHYEQACHGTRASPAVIHCVQGKDRTGMVSLCVQSLLRLSDEAILEDYHESERILAPVLAAKISRNYSRRIDPTFFAGAPKAVMRQTLQWLRETYGSVENYLEWIGFDASGQDRLVRAMKSAAVAWSTPLDCKQTLEYNDNESSEKASFASKL